MADGPMHGWTARLALAPGRAARILAALLFLVPQVAGCYSHRPIEGNPGSGTTVVLEVNDRGRVELADRVGASVERIQGTLQSVTDGGYLMRVQSVRYLNGQVNQWSGEEITVPASYVSRARQQVFSRTRTALLAAGIGAALVALVLSLDLVGGGATPGDDPKRPAPPES